MREIRKPIFAYMDINPQISNRELRQIIIMDLIKKSLDSLNYVNSQVNSFVLVHVIESPQKIKLVKISLALSKYDMEQLLINRNDFNYVVEVDVTGNIISISTRENILSELMIRS